MAKGRVKRVKVEKTHPRSQTKDETPQDDHITENNPPLETTEKTNEDVQVNIKEEKVEEVREISEPVPEEQKEEKKAAGKRKPTSESNLDGMKNKKIAKSKSTTKNQKSKSKIPDETSRDKSISDMELKKKPSSSEQPESEPNQVKRGSESKKKLLKSTHSITTSDVDQVQKKKPSSVEQPEPEPDQEKRGSESKKKLRRSTQSITISDADLELEMKPSSGEQPKPEPYQVKKASKKKLVKSTQSTISDKKKKVKRKKPDQEGENTRDKSIHSITISDADLVPKKKPSSVEQSELATEKSESKKKLVKSTHSITISDANLVPKKKPSSVEQSELVTERSESKKKLVKSTHSITISDADLVPKKKPSSDKKQDQEEVEPEPKGKPIRGTQSVTISEAHLQPSTSSVYKKKKKKKPKKGTKEIKESPSTIEREITYDEDAVIAGEKDKIESEPSLSRIKGTKKKGKTAKMKKIVSISQHSMVKRSKLSSQNILSKLSSHGMLEKQKSKSGSIIRAGSSAWTFTDSLSEDSEYSYEDVAEKKMSSVVIEKKTKQKKEKKKKKKKHFYIPGETVREDKKKKYVAEEEETEGTIEPQVDIMDEIKRMKYLAELATSEAAIEEETVTEPTKKKKKKKGPKKKLSKKEKQRLAAELAEKARLTAEEEAARAAELERIRLEEERKAAIEKEKREIFEQQIRMEQLEWILQQFNEVVSYNQQLRTDAKTQADWEFYVDCGRLPNPSQCDQMNTFLHLWENMIDDTSMEEAATRTVDVLELLNELDDLIDTSGSENIENWKWVRLLFRQQQAKSLDVATYRLLRNIEQNLNRIDIPTADYKYQDDNIALCLWLRIQLPIPLPNPRRPAKPRIEVNFPEMKMEVQFPPTIDGEKTAVRALYVKYDHLSDLSDSYQKPAVPDQYDIDLYTAMKKEWREKLIYKYKNRVRTSSKKEEGQEEVEQSAEDVIGPDDEIPIVPYRKLEPTASDYVIANEDTLYNQTRTKLIKTVDEDIINLRKYSIIGGVYALNLIHQPPQPQDFVTLEMNLTPLYLPKELELVDLYLEYDPPRPPDPGVRRLPEEIEEEMKKHDEELEKLILITLTWPEHVIFLELPMVCYWDEDRRLWAKNEVHDLKHNEEKGQLSFRTRKGGTFAMAVYRYANLPYQTWEMKPEANGSISVQITAAILMVEFNIKDGLIALSQLQNSPNNALQDVVGIYFPLPKLIRMLQSAGVDVFPAFDAFCYIETTCEKHWPMEKHLYFNMAQLGICFNFAWSRWNVAAGRRNIILQMREYNVEKTKQKNHLMLHVTPLSAIFVDCTEVSQTFNDEGIENMKFYPDLYHLMKGTSSMAVKNKIGKASKELIFALYELLVVTRVVSFS